MIPITGSSATPGVRSAPASPAAVPPATPAAGGPPPPPHDVTGLADHLFRHEAGKLVSVLVRFFGIERLDLAEDVVQEALARALQLWPYQGVPQNPAAWLTQTAKNLALDVVRREGRFREKQPAIIVSLEEWSDGAGGADGATADEAFTDDRLRLMFACCHPVLPPDAQTALALKTLCGFSPVEIARAFLSTEVAIAKRLTRARQRIQEAGIKFEIPAGPELPPRLDAVLQTLYLLFNEGYNASSGDQLVREELCLEAIRLAHLLATHALTGQPRTHALLALMCFNAARLPARVSADGELRRLKDQDRSRWDRALIARGLRHLAQSAAGDALSEYHLQAGIAACHCLAPDFASTDWPRILSHYDRLVELDDSPVVALNRAVALAQVAGPAAGLAAVAAMPQRAHLERYYLLHAVLGDLEAQSGRPAAAIAHFEKARQLTTLASEQAFLARRIRECAEAQ